MVVVHDFEDVLELGDAARTSSFQAVSEQTLHVLQLLLLILALLHEGLGAWRVRVLLKARLLDRFVSSIRRLVAKSL